MTAALARATPPAPGPDPEALPPAILMGGGENALSVARSLGRRGVRIFTLNSPSKLLRHSRYCEPISLGGDERSPAAWERFLLGSDSDGLRGAVLLACGDEGLEILAKHRQALAEKFLLDDQNDDARRCMLDKLTTYRAAEAAGIPTPRYWNVEGLQDLETLKGEFLFPIILKPLYSHHFQQHYRKKFLQVDTWDDLLAAYREVSERRIDVVLMEFIPGPDDQLCSYYTYLDPEGEPLFHFTKRVIRRYPVNMGGACYHATDWNPEVAELGLRLFRHVRLRGLGNVEFKRDPRDGQLKIIECNARFTAANCLVDAAGFDLAGLVYDRVTGRPSAPLLRYRRGLTLWYPWEDFFAFLELRERGELRFGAWLWSLLRPHITPRFAWDDPLPSLVGHGLRIRELLARRLGAAAGAGGA